MWWSALLQFYRPVLKGISRWTCWHNSFRVETSRSSVKMVRTHSHIHIFQISLILLSRWFMQCTLYPHHDFCHVLFPLHGEFAVRLNEVLFWTWSCDQSFFGNLFVQFRIFFSINLQKTVSLKFIVPVKLFWNLHFLLNLTLMKLFSGISLSFCFCSESFSQ